MRVAVQVVDPFPSCSVGGTLEIGSVGSLGGPTPGNNTLVSLAGLERLRSVGRDLYIANNRVLRNVAALQNLGSVGGSLFVANDQQLQSLHGFEGIESLVGLHIFNVFNLITLDGLQHLRSANEVQIEMVRQLRSFAGLSGLQEVAGRFQGSGQALRSANGLESLRSVGGLFSLSAAMLANIDALRGLRQVGGLGLSSAPRVTSLEPLSGLTVAADIFLENVGISSLRGLENLNPVLGSLTLWNLNQLTEIGSLSRVTGLGDLAVGSALQLRSLAGLGNVRSVRNLSFLSSGLYDFSGLEGVTSAAYLSISSNPYLSSLAGLDNLRTLVGLSVGQNPNLPACAVSELEAQTGAVCDPSTCWNNTGFGNCSE